MCFVCICCTSSKCCTFVFAFITGIEAFVFAVLNLVLILAYTCTIPPTDKPHLAAGFEFIEDVWSWFFYNNENCIVKQGIDYVPPPWISEPPEYIVSADVYYAATSYANYVYQILYIILNSLWFISAIFLLYGNSRKLPKYFLPWIIIGSLVIALDTICGSFYIRLMDETNPGWGVGKILFTMQFLYFRGFILYIVNVFSLVIGSLTYWKVYRKRSKQRKELKKRQENTEMMIQNAISAASPLQGNNPHSLSPQPGEYSASQFQSPQQREISPTKYRPFSYMNPGYRPTDPNDLEGMRINSPKPINRGFDNAALQTEANLNTTENRGESVAVKEVLNRYETYK